MPKGLEQPLSSQQKDPSPKRPISERKIKANRRSALRSTGPKTPRGKRNVSRNAIKHGILAREVVITAGDGEESLKDFHDLVEKLCEHYEPVGIVEGLLVQDIAWCWWGKARVIRAENGEIRKQLDTVGVDQAMRLSNKVNLYLVLSRNKLGPFGDENTGDYTSGERWRAMQVAQTELLEHPLGLEYLSELLKIAKSEIANDGHISRGMANKIFYAFCCWDYLLALACFHAGLPEGKLVERPSEQGVNKRTEEKCAEVVAIIDNVLEKIRIASEYATVRRSLALDSETRSFSLPTADATDKLLRYDAHYDKKLYRAMDQLERLQRQRRGEVVPPPLNINLGRGR